MPKRLCSIALTPDEQTIIAADKFGDVYALPLHPTDDFVAIKYASEVPNGFSQPSATELTVHTKGNLEALKQQQMQKQQTAKKEGPDFEHKLLLGHVSLLTDVAIASAEVSSKQRQFIVTADRDEHVRVSRYPQAHIIHTYCLGFRDFVSRICIVPWMPELLIVGSGEPSLKVFDWQRGKLVSHIGFDETVGDIMEKCIADNGERRSLEKLAISGIWPVNTKDKSSTFLVALEGLPFLFDFHIKNAYQLEYQQTILLSGNVLDVAVRFSDSVQAYVSLDNVHEPGSMLTQDSRTENRELIITLEMDGTTGQWSACEDGFKCHTSVHSHVVELVPDPQDQTARSSRARGEYSSLGEFLYGLENLRKKRGIYAEDVDESVEATDEVVPENAE